MSKKIKYSFVGIILILIIVFIGIHFIAPYAITQPQRVNEDITPNDLNLKSDQLNGKTKENFSRSGYWIKSEQDSARGIIILVHGIGGCKEHFLGLSKDLASEGIETIVFDGRAHGKSEGEFCTFGYKEKFDISKIVDEIKNKNPNLPIGIWGNSLGGAIAIQALEIENRIDFGIIESTFTELDKIVFDYKKRILKGFGIKRLSDYALNQASKIADFDFQKVKPIESVKKIEQPILMVHGDADKNISSEYGCLLYTSPSPRDATLSRMPSSA